MARLLSQGYSTHTVLEHNCRSHPQLTEFVGEHVYILTDKELKCKYDFKKYASIESQVQKWTKTGTLKDLFNQAHYNSRWAFFNTDGRHTSRDGSKSIHNLEGDKAVTTIIHSLTSAGISSSQIGVATYYVDD